MHDGFLCAIKTSDPSMIMELVKRRGGVDALDECGRTALVVAAINGDLFCIQKLLALGANVKAKDFLGETALKYAYKSGKRSCVDALKRAEEERDAQGFINWRSQRRSTPKPNDTVIPHQGNSVWGKPGE